MRTSAIAGAVDVVAGLYRRDEGMKLSWRGRFGSGEMDLSQHSNGSFNYLPSVPPQNMSTAEYQAKVEERLNQYYQACLNNAGKDGRVDVRKVVISIWGLKDGKFRDGSWNKTYKALDELVKRQKLRKKERQYYIVQHETLEHNKQDTETQYVNNSQKPQNEHKTVGSQRIEEHNIANDVEYNNTNISISIKRETRQTAQNKHENINYNMKDATNSQNNHTEVINIT